MSKSSGGPTDGFSRLARGLADLFDFLTELEQDGAVRRGRREKDGMVVEYSFGRRTLGETAASSEPEEPASAAPRTRPRGRARERGPGGPIEPVTDVFDEPDEIVVLLELPGIARKEVHCRLDGDILLLQAESEERRYRKEVLIDAKLADAAPRLRLRNGVLEVRLAKRK